MAEEEIDYKAIVDQLQHDNEELRVKNMHLLKRLNEPLIEKLRNLLRNFEAWLDSLDLDLLLRLMMIGMLLEVVFLALSKLKLKHR